MELMLITLIVAPLLIAVVLSQVKGNFVLWLTSFLASGCLFAMSLILLLQDASVSLLLPFFSHFGVGFVTTPFALVYAVVATGCWTVSIAVSRDYFLHEPKHLSRYYAALFLALGGTLGVFFADDLFTLVVFFEIMSLSSYLWVVHTQKKDAIYASEIYLGFGIAGGLCILYGIFGLSGLSDTLRISQLSTVFADGYDQGKAVWSCFFLFLGFGAKAGVFFIHDWMPTTYTASPAPASGLLSGILSKCGVYGILVVVVKIIPEVHSFASLILFLSVLNMLIGAGAAVLSGNLKRTLAFSSVSQMGFIFWGIAFISLLENHNTLAVYGTVFHMINHSLLKTLLFSISGIIFIRTGTLELEELRGYGRGKPWLQGLFLVGGLTIGGVPLFSGYISKTLLHEAVVEYVHYYPYATGGMFYLYEWAFLLAGGCTVAYMLKLYTCLFVAKPVKDWGTEAYASKKTLLALSAVALCLPILGMTANQSFAWIGAYTAPFFDVHPVDEVHYFAWVNLKGGLTSLAIGVVLFLAQKNICKNLNIPEFSEKLKASDNFIEKLYIPAIRIASLMFAVIMRLFDVSLETVALRVSQRNFKPLAIPETFFYGQENVEKKKRMEVAINESLAYSLLMFGLGFIFIIVYLLVVGGTI